MNTSNNSVTVKIPANSISKNVTLSISGGNSEKWITLKDLKIEPDQAITMQIKNAGQNLIINNTGLKTNATVLLKDGFNSSIIDIGQIRIDPGDGITNISNLK